VPEKNDFVPTVLPVEQGKALLKEVAECSTHFTLGDTLWMRGNWLEANGLIGEEKF